MYLKMHHICIAYDDETEKNMGEICNLNHKYVALEFSISNHDQEENTILYVLIRGKSGGVESIYFSIPAGNNSLECLFLIFSIFQSGN